MNARELLVKHPRSALGRAGLAAMLALVVVAACERSRTPDPSSSAAPEALISDQVHSGGQVGFFWLPPLVPAPALEGTFDGTQKPIVTITPLVTGAAPIAVYSTTSGPGSETVRVDSKSQNYIVNWHTDRFALDPAITYRIAISVSGRPVGFIDVDVLASQGQVQNVNTSEFVALVDGKTLPITWFLNACGSVLCTALDACHVAGRCDPMNGTCSNPVAADGAPCGEGICESGICSRQLIVQGGTFHVTQGISLQETGALVATVSDARASDQLTVVFDWGDGSPLTNGFVQPDGAVLTKTNPDHWYASTGTFNVTVTVTSAVTGATAVGHSVAVVGPQLTAMGTTFEVTQGVPLNGTAALMATVSDALHLDQLAVAIDWGDGSQVGQGFVQPDGTIISKVQPDHWYANTGSFDVTVTVTSEKTGATAVALSVAVVVPQIAVSGTTFSIAQGMSLQEAAVLVATVSDARPLDFLTVAFDWGDGSPVTSGFVQPDGTVISKTNPDHAYASSGQFVVTVTVTSEQTGATTIAQSTAIVSP